MSGDRQWSTDYHQQREVLALLYPLHINLVPILYSFTTTSLLPAELQLFSVALINLLLLSTSPQAQILSILLWVGGLVIVVLCTPVIRWGVAIARIPRWRLRRAGRIIQARQSFLNALNNGLQQKIRKRGRQVVDSDADEDDEQVQRMQSSGLDQLKHEVLSALHNFFPAEQDGSMSAVENTNGNVFKRRQSPDTRRKRRNTLPASAKRESSGSPSKHRHRRRSVDRHFFLSLTPFQASIRKWLYAGYVYLVIIFLILIPIRLLVQHYALAGHEPFGWAIGYLFGEIRDVRFYIVSSGLDNWIPLPPMHTPSLLTAAELSHLPRATYYRDILLGPANTRLLLAAHCAVVLALGLLTVLTLPPYVEVDTRRKVFHGTMVAMLLPTIPIDPLFVSLALTIVLACFCLLDLLRASQLPPLSRPIASFLAPFVDGRDNRGPVVISHIFLLIGCAVPLWLSLAGETLTADYLTSSISSPFAHWSLPTRDVSFLAGVICVGLGDAAASLIGRRFGRHKLPWAGGKSLEGSMAFAVAVAMGLAVGKGMLLLGGWPPSREVGRAALVGVGKGVREVVGGSASGMIDDVPRAWASLLGDVALSGGKMSVAAMGASLMEAVLTGGNDNVVVPVALWILVRALNI